MNKMMILGLEAGSTITITGKMLYGILCTGSDAWGDNIPVEYYYSIFGIRATIPMKMHNDAFTRMDMQLMHSITFECVDVVENANSVVRELNYVYHVTHEEALRLIEHNCKLINSVNDKVELNPIEFLKELGLF